MIDEALLPRFDPLDPVVLEDPYPTYARLRRAGPLCRGGPGQWFVTHHAEVARLLRDRRLGHEFPPAYHRFSAGDGPATSFFRRIMLDRDPPYHTRVRRLMAKAFGPALVRRLRDHVVDIVDELLTPALDRGRFDAVEDFGFRLPMAVVSELMGIPRGDREEVRPRAVELGRAFITSVPNEDRGPADEAVIWLRDYIGALVDARGQSPGDDLLSRMLTAEEDGERLTREEIVDNAVFVFFAGFETTMDLIGNGTVALMNHPDQLARFRANLSLAPTAVEEFLRYDAPVQGIARLALAPIEVGTRTIRTGRVVILLIGSANHDERQYTDPEALDIGRDPNPHFSFGGGIHHCLGAAIARVEAAAAFTRLLQRSAVLEPAGDPVRTPRTTYRTYANVPLIIKPA